MKSSIYSLAIAASLVVSPAHADAAADAVKAIEKAESAITALIESESEFNHISVRNCMPGGKNYAFPLCSLVRDLYAESANNVKQTLQACDRVPEIPESVANACNSLNAEFNILQALITH